jgi:hypothetical protein
MKKAELLERALNNTTIAELIAIINNNKVIIDVDDISEKTRIAFIKKNIKSILKNIIDSQF